MRRADIKAGEVYGYHRQRGTRLNPLQSAPVMILDTRNHLLPYSYSGQRKPLEQTSRAMGSGGFGAATIGIPAVRLAFSDDDPQFASKLARLRLVADTADWTQGSVGDEAGNLGEYFLVSSLAALHGDYLEVRAEQRAYEAERVRRQQERLAQEKADEEKQAELTDRLAALGIIPRPGRMFMAQDVITLRQADAEKLIQLAEFAKGMKP